VSEPGIFVAIITLFIGIGYFIAEWSNDELKRRPKDKRVRKSKATLATKLQNQKKHISQKAKATAKRTRTKKKN